MVRRREVELRQDGESGSHGEREWEGIFNPVRHPSPSLSPSVNTSSLPRLLSFLLRVHIQHDLVILNLEIQVTRSHIWLDLVIYVHSSSDTACYMLYDDTHHACAAHHMFRMHMHTTIVGGTFDRRCHQFSHFSPATEKTSKKVVAFPYSCDSDSTFWLFRSNISLNT